MTENLDDFEQSFLRFTNTLREFCDSILVRTEDPPEKMPDIVANLALGLRQYIDTAETILAEDLEHHISELYAGRKPVGEFSFLTKLDDKHTLKLPDYFCKLVDITPDTSIEVSNTEDGCVRIRKIT